MYSVPLLSGETAQEVCGALIVQLAPPGEAVIVYEIIAGPPVIEGGVSETVAAPFPMVAVTPVGTPGLPAGLIVADAADAELPAVALFAEEVNE